MIAKLLGWLKMVLNAADRFQSQQTKIEELTEQVGILTNQHEQLVAAMLHRAEIEKLEREKFKLEIMNELLRRLPPPPPPALPPPPQP